MRNINLLLALAAILLSISIEAQDLPVIKASKPNAQFRIENGPAPGNWSIMPEIGLDVFPVVVEKGQTANVTFSTDEGSLSFQIKPNEKKTFIVLLSGDTAMTQIRAVAPAAQYTKSYIKENRGKWSVEVVPAQELLQVIFAITPTGIADVKSFIINHDTTAYYLEVLEKFLPFRDEPIVEKIDAQLKSGQYINLKANACAMEMDENGRIVKSPIFDRMSGAVNPLDSLLDELNEFSKKTDFPNFYRQHKDFYDSLIQWHESAVPTKVQWDWLEAQFPGTTYDHYRITFSPLVKGNHSTVRFNNNGFKQAIMFIRPPYRVSGVSEKVSNGLITRFVFTEIDHNYVNPESDKHLNRINQLFADRNKWTNGGESKGYNSAYTVFNEYMTWSVYLVYCYDKYSKEDYEQISDRIIPYVSGRRGFSKFAEFHGQLLSLYQNRRSSTLSQLYPALLDWAESME